MIQIIISSLLCLAAVVMAFMRRLPAAVVAMAAMVVAGVTGAAIFTGAQYWFWGIAAAIVTLNLYMGEQPPLTPLRLYTAGGALAGCAIGAVAGYTAALIVAGAVGAFLGFEAFRRTPGGTMNATTGERLRIFADVALPRLVTFYIVTITLSQFVAK